MANFAKMHPDVLVFFVNGKKVVEDSADPEMTLLTYLRNKLRLTGSKLGCGEGGCGACTVMLSKWVEEKGRAVHLAINACLATVVSVHLCAVTTIEGIGSTKTRLHQVQERLADFHGSQCGFCTPGIVMSMYALLRNKPVPTSRDIDDCLQGNLCRCTGYRPILAAFQTFACGMGENCCKVNGTNGCYDESGSVTNGFNFQYDASQEIIFPPELKTLVRGKSKSIRPLTFFGERTTWMRPETLLELAALKARYPEARIAVGNTEIGVETNIKGNMYPLILCPSLIPEMNTMEVENAGVRIGSACSLSEVEEFLTMICAEKSDDATQTLRAILEMLKLFAGKQIRNVACIGGNIMTASPISDLNPIFTACGARLSFLSATIGTRTVRMDGAFFKGYRKTATKADEVLVDLWIPFMSNNDVFRAFKQSKRREDDIAIVNCALKVSFQPGTKQVEHFSAAYGGMAAVTAVPTCTRKMIGRMWDESLLEDTCRWLSEELDLPQHAPGGMVQFRRTLATSFFFKFYHHVMAILVAKGIATDGAPDIHKAIVSDIRDGKEHFSATQTWQEVPVDQPVDDTVGRPVRHLNALNQVTGEAQYIDDLAPYEDELYMALVYSTRPHAKIINVNTKEALDSEGVVSYVDKNDVPGSNEVHGEKVFADGMVTCVGDVVGAVIADSQEHAIRAARLVKIDYEELGPTIITIEDAIEHESYYEPKMRVKRGHVEDALTTCDHVLDGEVRIGGQDHFYLETQACIAIPKPEDGEIEILSSCQNPTLLQSVTAQCLAILPNKVTVRVKRMGGGFGGKETKFCLVSCPAAVAAKKLGKPIRCMLTRQDDMQITGGRHPFLARYTVGFSKDGHIIALKKNIYSNAGNTIDLSFGVMIKALTHCDNCYRIPHADIRGYVCRTNVASNTAMRGFGGPQGMLLAEDWITKIATYLSKAPEHIRKINMYKEGEITHFGARLTDFHARRCWKECMEKSEFFAAKSEIEIFNAENRWKKRGIACIPTKFSIGFGEAIHYNQAGALVLIYKDGSVLVSHGGTEMGQGLHTKMVQITGKVLGIPLSFIHISESNTASVPNTSATAASISSDLNGMAVKDACEKLMKRLEPIIEKNPSAEWREVAHKAYMERISLSATGHYKVPDMSYDWDQATGIVRGNMASYFAYGASASQVEIDVLTGDHIVLQTDLIMDVGNSLNPAIDIGQVEGAFAQGYGLVTLEEPIHSSEGRLWTNGPGSYKIPGFSDMPKKFSVHLLRSCPNEKAVFSSKAVGEPPLFLASSVFFAIKEAIASARRDMEITGPFRLDSPATAERIRLACEDIFTGSSKTNAEGDDQGKPWSVRT